MVTPSTPAPSEVEIKLRLHVSDIAGINLKVALGAGPAVLCQGDTANRVPVVLVRLVIALAVERKDNCLAVITEQAAVNEKGSQVSLKRPPGHPSANCHVDVGVWA
jgi:hypothetical protein